MLSTVLNIIMFEDCKNQVCTLTLKFRLHGVIDQLLPKGGARNSPRGPRAMLLWEISKFQGLKCRYFCRYLTFPPLFFAILSHQFVIWLANTSLVCQPNNEYENLWWKALARNANNYFYYFRTLLHHITALYFTIFPHFTSPYFHS